MSSQFCKILQSALRYEQSQRTIILLLLFATLVVLGLISLKVWKKASRSNRVCLCLIALAFFVAGCAFLIHDCGYQKAISADIHQECFVTYHGEFTHDDYQKDSFYHNISITDEDGKQLLLRLPDYANTYGTYDRYQELPIGTFTGTMTYSAQSKLVVSWRIDN